MSTIGTVASERGRGAMNHWRRGRDPVTISRPAASRIAGAGGPGEAVEKTRTGESLMKPLTMAIIGALVVAVAVFGYLYYQRTSNDITIQVPKVELKN
jgi:hypothetical protein